MWAVGCSACGSAKPKTLIVRWNGTTWRRCQPDPRSGALLTGVAAPSAGSAWAVGITGSASPNHKTLTEHWNGQHGRGAQPDPVGSGMLFSVAATSGRNAWAVGQTGTYATPDPRIVDLHWDGTAWKWRPRLSPAATGGASACFSGLFSWRQRSGFADLSEAAFQIRVTCFFFRPVAPG